MTERDLVMRRFDMAARFSLLAAGLAAQGAMWVAGPSRVYFVGALLLAASLDVLTVATTPIEGRVIERDLVMRRFDMRPESPCWQPVSRLRARCG